MGGDLLSVERVSGGHAGVVRELAGVGTTVRTYAERKTRKRTLRDRVIGGSSGVALGHRHQLQA